MGFLWLLVQIMAILIEPLAKRKLSVTLSSTLWGFPFAAAALSPETRAREGAAAKVPPPEIPKAARKVEYL